MVHQHEYYIPQGAREFLGWAKNFVEVARVNKTAFGFADAELKSLADAVSDLEAAVRAADREMAGKADIRRKNTILKDVRYLFRAFVNTRVNYNGLIDGDGRANLRAHVRDAARARIAVPTDLVRLRIRPLEGHSHRVDFAGAAAGTEAIPYGMKGVVLAVRILEDGEAVCETGEQLPDACLMTSSPHVIDYSANRAGKRAAYAAAWENEKGEKGTFSDVQVHVIP